MNYLVDIDLLKYLLFVREHCRSAPGSERSRVSPSESGWNSGSDSATRRPVPVHEERLGTVIAGGPDVVGGDAGDGVQIGELTAERLRRIGNVVPVRAVPVVGR